MEGPGSLPGAPPEMRQDAARTRQREAATASHCAQRSVMRTAVCCLVLLGALTVLPAPAGARTTMPQPTSEHRSRSALEVSKASRATSTARPTRPALIRRPRPLLPPLPPWARGPLFRGANEWKDFSIKQQAARAERVMAANQRNQTFDFLLYGDSITKWIETAIWNASFPSTTYLTAPLGVSGNDIEDLAWRLITGGERPLRPPRVVAVLIGVNNLQARQQVKVYSEHLKYVLQWCQAAMPGTKLMLLGLIPNANVNIGPTNRAFGALAGQLGIPFVRCGRDINVTDTADLADGLHPAPGGQGKLVRCLAAAVLPLLR